MSKKRVPAYGIVASTVLASIAMIIKASVDEAASACAADRMLPRCFSSCQPVPPALTAAGQPARRSRRGIARTRAEKKPEPMGL